jgi:hypothetical protein
VSTFALYAMCTYVVVVTGWNHNGVIDVSTLGPYSEADAVPGLARVEKEAS